MTDAAELDKEFIDFVAKMARSHGLDGLSSQLFGILYLEPDKMSMEELAERTSYSIASIHNALKRIEHIGFLKKTKKPGTKRIYYYMDKDFSKHIKSMLHRMYRIKVQPAKSDLPGIIQKYKENLHKNPKAKQKLKAMEDYYEQIQRFENILNYAMEHI